MKQLLAASVALIVFAAAEAAPAQVISTFLPPPAIAAPPAVAAPVVVAPTPVVTYYSAPVYGPVIYPRRYVVPAPVVVRPRTYVVRPKVYVRGQPLRNAIRATTP